MNKKFVRLLNRINPEYKFTFYKWEVRLQSLLVSPVENKYLFILSPPYCGSTLLNELISSSPSVSVNNPFSTREGQQLPSVRNTMFTAERWNDSTEYDWDYIKQEWRKFWRLNHPILLEKSPPNIVRAQTIQQHFDPSYFIVFYRNPYAHCESLIRRNNLSPKAAAEYAMRLLNYQKLNATSLKNKILVSYEMLTELPQTVITRIQEVLPELSNMTSDQKFAAHNYLNQKMGLKNLNADKINNLTKEQMTEINEVFESHTELLTYFGYESLS